MRHGIIRLPLVALCAAALACSTLGSPTASAVPTARALPTAGAAPTVGVAPTGSPAPQPTSPKPADTAFDSVIAMLGPKGEVSPAMALQAFALAVAPLPGVTPPAGAPGQLDADAAVAWVTQVWDQLSPAQQTAIDDALAAMPDPFANVGASAASAAGLTLAARQPATAAGPDCGLFLTDPAADPASLGTNAISPAVQPYVDMMKAAAGAIAGHLHRPSLPKLGVCLMRNGSLTGLSLTRLWDAERTRLGMPAACSIHLNADMIANLDQGDLGYVMAYQTFQCFAATADQTESLASSGARTVAPWVRFGAAAWAGATVAGELFGGGGDNLSQLWADYLNKPHESLYARTKSALGFFAQVDQDKPSVWNVLDEMLTAPDSLSAFYDATGRRQSFIDLWAAGYFRDASRGPDWDIVGPSITGDTAEAGSIDVANGESQDMAAPAFAVSTADLSTSADVTNLSGNHLRVHDGEQDFANVRNQAYCTRGGPGACACPPGTPGAALPPLPSLNPEVKLALTGMEFGGTATIVGLSLDDYCNPNRTPTPSAAADCSVGIPAGDYNGTLVYTSILAGHPPIHDGGGKIQFTVDADGKVTGTWDLAYAVMSFTGHKGTGAVKDGVVSGTARALLLSGTVVTAMDDIGAGPVVPWPAWPLTVQPVCDGKVVAQFTDGSHTVIVHAEP